MNRKNKTKYYCKQCGCCLNKQKGFKGVLEGWKCTDCGYVNSSQDDEGYIECDDCISIYDASDIYLCSGEDDDYSFGYSEDELNRWK